MAARLSRKFYIFYFFQSTRRPLGANKNFKWLSIKFLSFVRGSFSPFVPNRAPYSSHYLTLTSSKNRFFLLLLLLLLLLPRRESSEEDGGGLHEGV